MSVKKYSELENIDNLKPLGRGTYGKAFLYDENTALKIFYLNNTYQKLLKFHRFAFIEHLKRLSEFQSDILLPPIDIYTDKTIFAKAYTSRYYKGKKLSEDIDEIELDYLMPILYMFYDELSKISNLLLNDANPSNLILGDELKLFDLDYSYFVDQKDMDIVKENIKRLNYNIFRSLVKKKDFEHGIIDKEIELIVSYIQTGDIELYKLLEEYIDILNKKGYQIKYVKDLRIPYSN